MACISQKSGPCSEEALQEQLWALAREIAAGLSDLEPSRSKELLGGFVSELFFAVSEQERREDRRRRQAEGIAAAKARGVRFGRPAPPLPDNFEQARQAWREGGMSLRQAADFCGMARSSFYEAVARRERAGEQAG